MLSQYTPFPAKPLSRFLDTAGNGTGTKNAIGNYSAAATDFFIAPPAGTSYIVYSLLFQYTDGGSFTYNGFASGVALTNGIGASLRKDGVTYDLLDGVKIKTNDNWFHISADAKISSFAAAANTMNGLLCPCLFQRGLMLSGAAGDKIVVTLNDNFTTLIDHTYRVGGYYG